MFSDAGIPDRKRRPAIVYVLAVVAVVAVAVLYGAKRAIDALNSGSQELVDVPGAEAQPQMADLWPEKVEPAAVKSVSMKSQWTRHGYSMWLWAYEYFAQGDLLWQSGKLPSGKEHNPVLTSEEDVSNENF
jgi:hypothetical protein